MDHSFPDFQGNIMLSIDPKSEDGLKDVRELLQEQDNFQKSYLKLYEDSDLPMTVCAAKSGLDIQEYRAALFENDIRFRICNGTVIERKIAHHFISRNKESGCVVDALTAHIIFTLKLQGYIEAVCGPIHIAQSTLDSFAYRSLHFDHAEARSQGRMYMHDGNPTFSETPEEHLKSASEFRKAEWGWVQENTTVTAVIPDSDIPDKLRELESITGVKLLDSSVIARSNNLLLISEDKEIRELSTNLMGTKATWLQPILDIGLHKGIIPRKRYCEITTEIALSCVSFYPVTAECLYYQAEKDNFKLSANFMKLLLFLGAPNSIIRISADVAGEFLKFIWRLDIDLTDKCQYASAIFEALTKHKKSEQAAVLGGIMKAARSYGYFIPDLYGHAISWHRGHNIGLGAR